MGLRLRIVVEIIVIIIVAAVGGIIESRVKV